MIIFFLFLFSKVSLSQEKPFDLLKDTTIYFNELTFHSDEEKDAFEKVYKNQGDDYLSLLFFSSPDFDKKQVEVARIKINQYVAKYKSKKKKEEKWIKWIYKDVHEGFFKKYEQQNYFEDVFTKGYFNCVSATAIYSIILKELNIPYHINVLPNHVNLTAYPKTHNILLETTDPVAGFFAFSQKNKEDYVKNLVKYKIIEEHDLSFISYEQIFNEYFSSSQLINLRQLVALQYFNYGLYLKEENKLEEAIIQIEKSVALYPSINSSQVLGALYSKAVENHKDFKLSQVNYIVRVLRYHELDPEISSFLTYSYAKIAEEKLLNQKDTVFFDDFSNQLINSMNQSDYFNRLNYLYHSAKGEFYLKESAFEAAYLSLEKAKEFRNDSIIDNFDEFYVKSFLFYVDDKFTNEDERLKQLLLFEKENPIISDTYFFLSYKAEVLTFVMIVNFKRNLGKKGEENRVDLEQMLDNKDFKKNENAVAIAYAEAGAYYFRLGSKSKARQLFRKGLEYLPGNYELENRINMLNY